MALLPLSYMGSIKIDWNDAVISKSSILDILEEFVNDFNSSLPFEYHLITRENIGAFIESINEKIIDTFVLCKIPEKKWYSKLLPNLNFKEKPIENTQGITANEIKKPNEVPKLPQKLHFEDYTNNKIGDITNHAQWNQKVTLVNF